MIISYIITRNGISNYLIKVINNLKLVADYILVDVSEKSTDQTYVWCKAQNCIDRVIADNFKFPQEEWKIRYQAYQETKKDNPDADYLIGADDDEIYPIPEETRKIIQRSKTSYVGMVPHHLWERNMIRIDGTWLGLRITIQNLNRITGQEHFVKTPIHCGRIPKSPGKLTLDSQVPVLHFGWLMDQEDRIKKMEEKKRIDTNPSEFQKKHYQSIYEEPVLREIPEEWKKWI